MSELRSALDGLGDVDFTELSDRALLELVAEWSTAANRMTAALTSAVRAADRREAYGADGAVSMKAWLRGMCHLAPGEATAIVSTGRRLEQLPATGAAFAAGEITATHARVITRAVTPRRVAKAADAGLALAETDQILAGLARETTPEETAQAVARWVAGVDPDGALDDAADVRRRFSMATTLGGRVHLRGELDPVGGEYLHTALAALMNGDRPAGDRRSHAERQADALVALARCALDGGSLPDVRGERPHVRVTIDWMALSAERGSVGVAGGELAWAGPITPETARRLACDASVARIITGPDGLPLDVGRRPRCRGPRRACEAWGAAGSFHLPAVTLRPSGATSTTWSTGPSAARPAATTGHCSANATTRRATRAGSPSGGIPAPADGAPTARTGPRSAPAPAPEPETGQTLKRPTCSCSHRNR